MGEVFQAYDTQRDRQVALKLLPESLASDQEYRERFKRESLVAARLLEPHIIPIHDFGEVGGQLFIDMGLVDGTDLRALLARDGRIAPQRAVHLVDQVAQALDAAHADHLVHRDIKPSNILVTPGDFVYVADFGLARPTGSQPTAPGTLQYTAPERFADQDVDGRADVYSLACVLHECLTGTPPFSGKDLPGLIYAQLHSSPPRASSLVEDVPPVLDAVIARGMAKDPRDRYPTAGLLAQAAREALLIGTPEASGLPLPPAVAPGEPERGPVRRHLALLILAAAAALALAIPLALVLGSGAASGNAAATDGAAGTTDAGNARAASLTAPTVAGKIRVGPTPSYVQVSPNGKYAYVTDPGSNSVTVLNTANNLLIGTIKIPQGPPQFVSFAPDGRTAYVSVYNGRSTVHLIAFVNTATRTVTAAVPVNNFTPGPSTTSPDGRYLYVPNHNTAMSGRDENVIDVIDTTRKKLVGNISVPANPHWVVFGHNGRFYATDHMSAVVTVLSDRTNHIITEIKVGETPHSEALSPDGSRLAITSFSGNEVFIVDTATDQEVAQVPVGKNPLDIAYSPDGRYLFTVNNEDNTVTVIDTADNRVIAEIPTGQAPTSISVLPSGRQAYVSDEGGGTVEVLDIPR